MKPILFFVPCMIAVILLPACLPCIIIQQLTTSPVKIKLCYPWPRLTIILKNWQKCKKTMRHATETITRWHLFYVGNWKEYKEISLNYNILLFGEKLICALKNNLINTQYNKKEFKKLGQIFGTMDTDFANIQPKSVIV